ncbi:MAG: type II secretion system protein GspG [Verrucomicrobia bacterium]|nr:MAG: type II secretion system protein GspG [Verrucomicrobiota bacterium]
MDTKFFMNTTHTYCQTHATRRLSSQRGFTLLEMVIVLGIIGLIIGGAIGVMGKVGDGAAIQRVKGDFNSLGSVLKMYKINNGFYPSTSQGLNALVTRPSGSPAPKSWTALADRVPLDPWGLEYVYRFPGSKVATEFELITRGKDGQLGTSDDISSQE